MLQNVHHADQSNYVNMRTVILEYKDRDVMFLSKIMTKRQNLDCGVHDGVCGTLLD